MRLVLLGPPGAGKGVQADLITKKLNIPHISTGDMLRAEVAHNTDLGKAAKGYLTQGELVPDDIIIEMIKKRLKEKDADNGFLFDGFPRTMIQAQSLDEVLEEMNLSLDAVINLDTPEEVIIRRLSNRRTCKDCNAIYNLITMPPKREGKCDNCGGDLYTRTDDKEEVIRSRLNTYNNQTAPLIKYYQEKDLLYSVNGGQEAEFAYQEIEEILRRIKNLPAGNRRNDSN